MLSVFRWNRTPQSREKYSNSLIIPELPLQTHSAKVLILPTDKNLEEKPVLIVDSSQRCWHPRFHPFVRKWSLFLYLLESGLPCDFFHQQNMAEVMLPDIQGQVMRNVRLLPGLLKMLVLRLPCCEECQVHHVLMWGWGESEREGGRHQPLQPFQLRPRHAMKKPLDNSSISHHLIKPWEGSQMRTSQMSPSPPGPGR